MPLVFRSIPLQEEAPSKKKRSSCTKREDKVEEINNANRSQITNNRDEIIYCSLLLNNLSDKSHLIYNTPKGRDKNKLQQKKSKETVKSGTRRISYANIDWYKKRKRYERNCLYKFFIHAEISPNTININLKSHKIRNRNVKNSLFLFIFC